MIIKLTGNDLKARYSGSALGLFWAYVQPLVTMLVFWFVFQVGFRNPPVSNVEYILWFAAGFVPWTFFSDGIMSSSFVFYEYSYLVKKMKFNVWLLPMIKVTSSFCIHFFLLLFLIGLYLFYGHKPSFTWFGVLYYSFCVFALLIGNAYLVGALSVFFKDATQMVNVIMQIGFWVTPVFWSDEAIGEGVLNILKLNPMHYVLTGYRNTLIYSDPFKAGTLGETIYFWCFVLVMTFVGTFVYRKLRKHFSDLL
ncbi:MAG: ABC transporter permease [Lachnospiraceae bacterium]|nr:ABC transporter permease [Lachnospiraceae bacterium]